MKNKYIILTTLLLFYTAIGFSQGRFYATGANTAYIDQSYKIVYVLENMDGSRFQAPNFEGFKILQGPIQGSSYQNYNGQITQSVNLQYYLQALTEGELIIGPASVEVGGKKIYTQEIKVNVLAAKAKTPAPSQAQQNPQNNIDWEKQAKENLFVRLYTDNQEPYVGEQIFVFAKLYLRMDIYGSQVTSMPNFQGFWKQELTVNSEEGKIEEYNGVRYNTYMLAKYALFPLKEGNYKIDPIKMKSIILVSVPTIENFFGMQIKRMSYQQEEYEHASNALSIKAKALPKANKPEDFIGAVGKFKLESSIDSTSIVFGNGIKLKTSISGSGNIMAIQEPIFEFPRQLEVFDPIISENVSKRSNYINGTKSFEYIIVPKRPGNFTIPSTQFSYFDLETESYISLSSSTFEIKVSGELPQTLAIDSNETLNEISSYELYAIANNYDLKQTRDQFYGSLGYYTALGAPILIYLFFLLGLKLKDNFQLDLVALRNKRASNEARKRLMKAKTFLDAQNKQAFYQEIFNAFNGYVADKFNVKQSELNKELALEKFKEKNINSQLIDQFQRVLVNAEEALYSPISASKMQEDFDVAIQWIVNVEHEIV
jgi:hypothetical protein